jgi:hypothetical protein
MGWQCVVLRSSLMSSRAALSCAASDAAAMHLTDRPLPAALAFCDRTHSQTHRSATRTSGLSNPEPPGTRSYRHRPGRAPRGGRRGGEPGRTRTRRGRRRSWTARRGVRTGRGGPERRRGGWRLRRGGRPWWWWVGESVVRPWPFGLWS